MNVLVLRYAVAKTVRRGNLVQILEGIYAKRENTAQAGESKQMIYSMEKLVALKGNVNLNPLLEETSILAKIMEEPAYLTVVIMDTKNLQNILACMGINAVCSLREDPQ